MNDIEKLPEGTHTIAIGFGDLNGIMRGKRIPATNWENVCKNGTAICLSALVYDMTCDVWDTPIANNDNGYPAKSCNGGMFNRKYNSKNLWNSKRFRNDIPKYGHNFSVYLYRR